MKSPSPADRSGKTEFNGVCLRNEGSIKQKKSIIICGITRGGTSFAGSVFGNLGVPFSREGEREIGRRYEHRGLRAAFQARDGAAIQEIASDFSAQHRVWAWKLPAIQRDIDFVATYVENPHFVIIFKEPLSVAWRKTDLKGKETMRTFAQVLTVYQHLLKFAAETKYPLMLMSYDRGMSALDKFLPEVAEFAGVKKFDLGEAIKGIREDGQRYFRPEPGEQESPDGEPDESATAEAPIRKKRLKAKADRKLPMSYL